MAYAPERPVQGHVNTIRSIKIGLIGAGGVAREVYIPALKLIPGVEISCISDLNFKRFKRLKDYCRNSRFYSDYRDLLNEDLDSVVICTPNHLHAKMCIEAANSHKNILVEKPLALTAAEAEEVREAAAKNKVKICVSHNYIFNPAILSILNIIDRGMMGDILGVNAIKLTPVVYARRSLWKGDDKKSGGELLEFIHPLYLLNYFGGDVEDIQVVARRVKPELEKETDVRALIRYKNGPIGYLEMTSFAAINHFTITVNGTGSSVRADMFNASLRILSEHPQLSELYHALKDAWHLSRALITRRDWYRKHSSHLVLIGKYIESIREDHDPPITVQEGVNAVKLAEAIKESMMKNVID